VRCLLNAARMDVMGDDVMGDDVMGDGLYISTGCGLTICAISSLILYGMRTSGVSSGSVHIK
jgi:hypothetical protein